MEVRDVFNESSGVGIVPIFDDRDERHDDVGLIGKGRTEGNEVHIAILSTYREKLLCPSLARGSR